MPNSVVVVVAGDDKTGEVFNAVKKHMDETKAKAKETSEALGEIGEQLKHGLELAGIAVTAKEAIAQIKEAVAQAAEFGETIAKASERTGMAAGTLSVLHYAAAVTSTDFDKLVTASGKMGKNLADAADGNKKLDAAFQRIGITAKEIVNRHDALDIVMQHLAKTMEETESPARRLQLAGDLLGKQGQANIPVLMNLAEHFEELKKKAQDAGVYLNEMSAKELQEMNAKMKDLQQHILGAKVAFADGLTPALEGIIKEFTSAQAGTNIWSTAGRQAGLVAVELATVFKWLADFIRETKNEYINLSSAINAFDYNIGSKLNWTKKYRDEEAARRDAALKAMHDSKMDHEAMLAEEQKFVADMKQVEAKLLNPSASESAPGDGGDGGDGGGWDGSGSGGALGKSKKDAHAFIVNTRELEAQALKEHADFIDKIQALNRSLHHPTLYGPEDYAKEAAMQVKHPDITAKIDEIPLQQLALRPLQKDYSALLGAGEKLGHAVFDPLFDMSMSWDNKWRATRDNLLRDIGQLAESQVFKMLFGDPQGRGGQGLSGTSWEGNSGNPRSGVQGAPGGLLGGLLNHFLNRGSSATSNGGLGGGAGTVATAAASVMQMGKGTGTGGGVQVVLNNNGAPLQVDSTQQNSDGGEGHVVQIMLKQLETNGPVAQGIMGLMGML